MPVLPQPKSALICLLIWIILIVTLYCGWVTRSWIISHRARTPGGLLWALLNIFYIHVQMSFLELNKTFSHYAVVIL